MWCRFWWTDKLSNAVNIWTERRLVGWQTSYRIKTYFYWRMFAISLWSCVDETAKRWKNWWTGRLGTGWVKPAAWSKSSLELTGCHSDRGTRWIDRFGEWRPNTWTKRVVQLDCSPKFQVYSAVFLSANRHNTKVFLLFWIAVSYLRYSEIRVPVVTTFPKYHKPLKLGMISLTFV